MAGHRIAADHLGRVFPFHLVVDERLRVLDVGPALRRLLPGLVPGEELAAHFELERPRDATGYPDLARDPGELVLLAHRDSPLRLRGQAAPAEEEGVLLLLLMPWITEVSALSRIGLSLRDLPHHTAASDLLFLLQAKQSELDSRALLNERLREQRRELEAANRSIEVQRRVLHDLSFAQEPRHAVALALRTVCEYLGWTSARLWSLRGGELIRDASWPPGDRTGGCAHLAATAAREGRVVRVSGGGASCALAPAGTACDAAPQDGFAVPVQDGDGSTRGVLTLSGPKTPELEADIEGLLPALGRQIGRHLALSDARQALEAGRRLHAAIIGGALHAIVTMDARGTILEFNAAAERTFGWTAAEVVGRPMADHLVPPRVRDAHLEAVRLHLEQARTSVLGRRVTLRGLHKDGHEFPVELALTRIDSADGPLFTGHLRDLTQQVRAEAALQEAREQAEQASRAKSRFLATISHEIRTPMNAVLGLTALALEEDGPRREELMRRVLSNAEALLALLNDVLDISRIEAGETRFLHEPFSLDEVLRSATDTFQPRARARGLQLALEVAPGLSPVRIGDPGRLRQVLVNLVSNAVKFTQQGEVRVEALPGPGEERVLIRVVDTGPGVAAEDRERIFGSFVQLGTDGGGGGAGLGLAISRSLAEGMGGTLELRERPGGGSIFELDLPLPAGEALPATPASPAEARGPRPAMKARVLVVDDSEDSLTLAAGALEAVGVSVLTARTGEQAVRAAADEGFDLVLMDLDLPGIDGLEATARIRAAEAEAGRSPAPILAFSAHALPGTETRCREAGMQGFLAKPVRPETLRRAVLEHADRRPWVAVVDDAPDQRLLLAAFLRRLPACRVWPSPDGSELLRGAWRPALLLLDLELGARRGEDVLRDLTEAGRRPPQVWALTGHVGEEAERHTRGVGFDAHLGKPVRKARLLRLVDEALHEHEPQDPAAKDRTR